MTSRLMSRSELMLQCGTQTEARDRPRTKEARQEEMYRRKKPEMKRRNRTDVLQNQRRCGRDGRRVDLTVSRTTRWSNSHRN